LLASLAIWHRALGSISVDTVREPRTEIFYWLTITFSQTLVTALGGWVADTGGLGYAGAALTFDPEGNGFWRGMVAERAGRTALEGAAPITTREAKRAARHQPRQARYAEVQRLADAGATVSAIARACELDRKTVRKWLREDGPGTWNRPSSAGILEPYLDRLERRWGEGSRNATRLWAELVSVGFKGGRSTVRAWVTRRRRASSDALDPKPTVREGWKPPSVVRVARLIQADPADMRGLGPMFLNRLLAEVPALAEVRNLARGFAALVRKEGMGTLDDWLTAAAGTPLKSFAAGLDKDLAAVRTALETPWSTGPVEGQISRLKTIKPTMYGRAGFALLRSRVLNAA
jgi:transposase